MRKLTVALALATAAAALAAGTAGPASAAPEAGGPAAAGRHLTLHSWTLLNEHGPGPNPGERLTALVDARTVGGGAGSGATGPGRARGHAVAQHVFDKDGTVRVEFDIDCLTVDADGAVTVTGPIESVTLTRVGGQPTVSHPDWHPQAGLTFYPADGNGERRVGWAASDTEHPDAPARVTSCTPVPADLWVIDGGTVLRR
ncbi:hypothetical protein ABTZ03_29215 [Kitasatospora sp. NPDC096077]|uniref:hypothetical protein n=1 Tax=Kitasatospora sp. NPDC096077 TaxID=3155544 RepID=UPI0033293F0F